MLARYIYAGGMHIAKVAGADTSWYHCDALGSTRTMTDELGTSVTWSGSYYPFGEATTSGTRTNTHQFTSKELDSEMGLNYFCQRYYDPQIGRFMTLDPFGGYIELPQSQNRYAYCINNPLKNIDPLGLAGDDYSQMLWQMQIGGDNIPYWIGGPVSVYGMDPSLFMPSTNNLELVSSDPDFSLFHNAQGLLMLYDFERFPNPTTFEDLFIGGRSGHYYPPGKSGIGGPPQGKMTPEEMAEYNRISNVYRDFLSKLTCGWGPLEGMQWMNTWLTGIKGLSCVAFVDAAIDYITLPAQPIIYHELDLVHIALGFHSQVQITNRRRTYEIHFDPYFDSWRRLKAFIY